MLEKPNIPDARIIASLEAGYGLQALDLTFLPLGVDINTAVYRFTAQSPGGEGDVEDYFLKLRGGPFDELSVLIPLMLSQAGNEAIISPLPALNGSRWARMDEYTLILYPFIAGRDGYEQTMTKAQWLAFGRAMHAIHSAHLPSEIITRIATEVYNPLGRERVKAFQVRAEQGGPFADPVAERLADFMNTYQAEISRMVRRAGELAHALRARELPFVLCHADIHAGNLLLPEEGSQQGRLYIVDWDQPRLAPKELDLALIIGGADSQWRAQTEGSLFYQGYGDAQIDPMALSYFRFERIIQDIAEFSQALLTTGEGGEDREQAYRFFTGMFLPGHDVEIAFKTDEGI